MLHEIPGGGGSSRAMTRREPEWMASQFSIRACLSNVLDYARIAANYVAATLRIQEYTLRSLSKLSLLIFLQEYTILVPSANFYNRGTPSLNIAVVAIWR